VIIQEKLLKKRGVYKFLTKLGFFDKLWCNRISDGSDVSYHARDAPRVRPSHRRNYTTHSIPLQKAEMRPRSRIFNKPYLAWDLKPLEYLGCLLRRSQPCP
jgi:hypothetical protein